MAGESRAPARFWECVREVAAGVFQSAPEAKPAMLDQCRTPNAADLQEWLRQESDDPDEPAPEARSALPAGLNIHGSYFQDSNIRVVRKRSSIRSSPYIMAGVGKEVIASHSGIGSANLICWINQLVDGE